MGLLNCEAQLNSSMALLSPLRRWKCALNQGRTNSIASWRIWIVGFVIDPLAGFEKLIGFDGVALIGKQAPGVGEIS